MITLIDNYDSFTYNLVHYLGDLGVACRVYRNDKISVEALLAEEPSAIVLSPGTTADDIEGWDSGRMIELIIAAEAKFGVRFTTREVDGMARVADFVETIARKTAGS